MAQPADPGWQATDDGCGAIYTPVFNVPVPASMSERTSAAVTMILEAVSSFPVGVCELDPDHVDRGEPHSLTLTWFDLVAEPDCSTCADTGQFAGQPCPENCTRAKLLKGDEPAAAPPPLVERGGMWLELGDDQQ